MAILNIKLYGDSVLRRKCKKVEKVDQRIRNLMQDMAQTMHKNQGVGLAAPQVGVSERVIVVDVGEGLLSLANPKIIQRKGKVIGEEGCLSLPDVILEMKRSQKIIVEGLNKKGQKIQIEAVDLFARAIQHEIDHLDGVLIVDQVSKKQLKKVNDKLKKI